MSGLRQSLFCIVAAASLTAQAQNPSTQAPMVFRSGVTNRVPPLPQTQPPVNFFRQLLSMSPSERAQFLTNRPPQIRARIQAKVREYQLLNADEREARLRATELRWYLTPLLRAPAAERQTRLASVPDDLRGLVKSRLMQWEILPPPLQQEFLENDQALHYFAHVETTNRPAASPEQQNIADQFNQFFELTPKEKQAMLNTLSTTEHAEMEKTLHSFEKLPPQQRQLCVRNYAKFAGMNAAERADFLKNAESWSKMSPQERQTWRDLVQTVPIWPPMPPPLMPPMPPVPHATAKTPRTSVATNLN